MRRARDYVYAPKVQPLEPLEMLLMEGGGVEVVEELWAEGLRQVRHPYEVLGSAPRMSL